MMFLTNFADQAVMLPVVFAICTVLALQGWWRGVLAWLGVVAATFGAMLVLKLGFFICAPALSATLIGPPLIGSIDIQSPSGHVAAAATVCGGLAALLTRHRIAVLATALLAAAAIGVSRVALGMHSLPEVVLGATVGLAGAMALLTVAGAPPSLRPRWLLAVVVAVAALFHGMHMPAEAAIHHTALRMAHLLSVHQPQTLPR